MVRAIFEAWRRREVARAVPEEALAHVGELYRIALFLLGSRGAAERAVEKAYTRFRNGPSRRSQVGTLRVDLLRALLAEMETIRGCPSYGEIGDSGGPLMASLSCLPRALRVIVILDVTGWEVEEVAAAIGLPPAAVRRRQSAAWNSLLSERKTGNLLSLEPTRNLVVPCPRHK
jgi:DNA-directed RNA polymerase specialized sigma24 family protein